MDPVHLINYASFSSTFTITALVLAGIIIGCDLEQPFIRSFFAATLFGLASVSSEILASMLAGVTSPAATFIAPLAVYATYVFPALQSLAFSQYIYRYLKSKLAVDRKPFYLIIGLSIVTIIFATVALPNDLYVWFDESNRFHLQETQWIASLFPFSSLSILAAILLPYLRLLSARDRFFLLFYPAVIFIALIIEMLVPGIWPSYIGDAIALFLIYANLQVDQSLKLREQEKKLAESRVSIMLSQIKPHFLANALSAICDLCEGNPEVQQAIITFSEYLRGNMESLAYREPIPFERELEHTKQYLQLEQLRLAGRLHVVYEIDELGFNIPTLTLQPLVENAVRHGVAPMADGGTIRIRTAKTARSYLVSVIDDGRGFDSEAPPKDEARHIGIANVRERLATLCDGMLEIKSTPSSGTTAVMTIPKRREHVRDKSAQERPGLAGGRTEAFRGDSA